MKNERMVIVIDLENDAFKEENRPGELAKIFQTITNCCENDIMPSEIIQDSNGNTVGVFMYFPGDQK